MSREDPTPQEEEFVENRAAYEQECLTWKPGAPWPTPPLPVGVSFRPSSLFDDGDQWMLAMSNYYGAVRDARSGKLPQPPRKLPGKPRKGEGGAKKPGRPKQFAAREAVGLTKEMWFFLDEAKGEDESLADVIRRCIELAFLCDAPELAAALDKEMQPGEKRPDTIRRLLTMGLLDASS